MSIAMPALAGNEVAGRLGQNTMNKRADCCTATIKHK
jgi:hypothetical protein